MPVELEKVEKFVNACGSGNLSLIEDMLKYGEKYYDYLAPYKNIDSYGLHAACAEDQVEIVSYLLQKDAYVNKADAKGNTPLLIACSAGHLDTVKKLLECDKILINYPNTMSENKELPLWVAAAQGHFLIVAELLKCPKINIFTTVNNQTAEEVATEKFNLCTTPEDKDKYAKVMVLFAKMQPDPKPVIQKNLTFRQQIIPHQKLNANKQKESSATPIRSSSPQTRLQQQTTLHNQSFAPLPIFSSTLASFGEHSPIENPLAKKDQNNDKEEAIQQSLPHTSLETENMSAKRKLQREEDDRDTKKPKITTPSDFNAVKQKPDSPPDQTAHGQQVLPLLLNSRSNPTQLPGHEPIENQNQENNDTEYLELGGEIFLKNTEPYSDQTWIDAIFFGVTSSPSPPNNTSANYRSS